MPMSLSPCLLLPLRQVLEELSECGWLAIGQSHRWDEPKASGVVRRLLALDRTSLRAFVRCWRYSVVLRTCFRPLLALFVRCWRY